MNPLEVIALLGMNFAGRIGSVWKRITGRISRRPRPSDLTAAEYGAWAERQAAKFLKRKGFKVLTRNYQTERGELDLVARDAATVVFVEVKAVRSFQGEPFLKVNREKRRRMIAAAKQYIARYNLHDRPARFDVVTVQCTGRVQIEHEEDAFQA